MHSRDGSLHYRRATSPRSNYLTAFTLAQEGKRQLSFDVTSTGIGRPRFVVSRKCFRFVSSTRFVENGGGGSAFGCSLVRCDIYKLQRWPTRRASIVAPRRWPTAARVLFRPKRGECKCVPSFDHPSDSSVRSSVRPPVNTIFLIG